MQSDKNYNSTILLNYSTWGELSPTTTHIIIAFHGYGMLARFFIKKFEIFDPKTHFVIAPQGISTFYLEGFSGRVGASWMTKENREVDILNQRVMIENVLKKEMPEHFSGQLIFFGFSQGTATATRFLSSYDGNVSQLILWAGKFPEDTLFSTIFQKLKITYVTGRSDPFLEENTVQDQLDLIQRKYQANANVVLFDGKHEILPDVLRTILQ